MNILRFFTLVLIAGFFSLTQAQNTKFDQKLADSLGADPYGMRNYFLVILKTGENDAKITDKTKRSELFNGHMANIKRLSEEGKIIVAGPFGENNLQFRGLFIINAKDEAEVTGLLHTDPTVKEKIFGYDIVPWYGSAALPLYLKYHDSVTKENF